MPKICNGIIGVNIHKINSRTAPMADEAESWKLAIGEYIFAPMLYIPINIFNRYNGVIVELNLAE